MALTSRERIIMILAIAAVAVLAGDRYVLSPFFEHRSERKQLKESLRAELEQSVNTMNRTKSLQVRFSQMQQDGLTSKASSTESLVLRFLQESARDCQLVLTSIQPEQSRQQSDEFGRIDFFVSGSGDMKSVTRFMWLLETAPLPLKVKSFQLGAGDENASRMSLQLTLSSIYMIEKAKQAKEQQI